MALKALCAARAQEMARILEEVARLGAGKRIEDELAPRDMRKSVRTTYVCPPSGAGRA